MHDLFNCFIQWLQFGSVQLNFEKIALILQKNCHRTQRVCLSLSVTAL